jgi:hypothetical protein
VSPDSWTALVVVLLVAATLAGAVAWLGAARPLFAPASAVLLGAAALTAALPAEILSTRGPMVAVTVAAGLLAVVGGGPVTARVFDVVDRNPETPGPIVLGSMAQAGQVLRGGAWIGALERLAVFAGLAAGFPEGVAVVLALKGVGRFNDLKSDQGDGAATERFIIGTFTSVLWAAACAGVVALVAR